MRISRRQFLKAASAGVTAAGLASRLPAAGATKTRPPNLLFLWTDQQRPDTLGCYGNRLARTPNLDALAAQSALFENARVAHPVCTPSRSAIMTGRWPHQTGVTGNNLPLPASARCHPELLPGVAAGDYVTGYMGKWHLGDEIFAQHGFQEWVSIEDNYESFFSVGRDRAARSDYHHFLVAHGQKPDRPNNTFRRTTACRMPLPLTKPEFLADRATDFLRRHGDRPFLLHVNYLEPHNPFISALRDSYAADTWSAPATFDRALSVEMPLRARLRQPATRALLPDEAAWRDIRAHYWGLTQQVDRSVGRILAALDRTGQADNTVVIFTSDHGEMMGEHRLLGKGLMFESALRVPLFIRAPRLRAQRISHPISLIDLTPTLLDLLGAPIPADLPGHSLRPALAGDTPVERDVFCQWSPNRLDKADDPEGGALPGVTAAEIERAQSESTRTLISPAGLKLCLRDSDRSTLTDLRKDPEENENLFGHAAYRDAQTELTRRLSAWQQRTADPLRLP